MEKTKITFHTFGCRLNYSETVSLKHEFEKKGFEILSEGTHGDIVVINTCTVTENGDADTRRFVRKVCRENPDAKIALIGCQAQIQKSNLKSLPNVRWIIGNDEKMDLARIIGEHPGSREVYVSAPAIRRKSFKIRSAAIDIERTRAHLKIQDGCDVFCSFCVIPYARGRARSREYPDIIKEARSLIAAGHKEIVLTGINIGTYCYEGKDFCDVLKALSELDLQRVRISSIEPTTVPEKLIGQMAVNTKICRHLHIPLQSASDKVLKVMRRQYTAGECADIFAAARKNMDRVCLGTDIIVGFPGESEMEFEKTYRYLDASPLSYFHIFSYSERTMAKSASFPEQVDGQTIKKRSRLLRALGKKKREAFTRQHEGSIAQVLFEAEKDGFWQGLTDNYIRVYVKSSAGLRNGIYPVRLVSRANNGMTGVLL